MYTENFPESKNMWYFEMFPKYFYERERKAFPPLIDF